MPVTQIIDETEMYLTHYSQFEEPDPGIPVAIYLDQSRVIDPTLDLVKPVAIQHFHGPHHALTGNGSYFKVMPYGIAPVGLTPPLPPQVLALFRFLFGSGIQPSDITSQIVAVGTHLLPTQSQIHARLHAGHFEVTKEVRFQVRIRVTFLYAPAHLAVASPYITNLQAASFWNPPLPIPAGTDPNGELTYEWFSTMTLSTNHVYQRTVASQPPPFADPFDPSETEILLAGKPVDAHGNYTIVGATEAPHCIQSPTSTVPDILGKLFGANVLTDCELAYSESGRLLPF